MALAQVKAGRTRDDAAVLKAGARLGLAFIAELSSEPAVAQRTARSNQRPLPLAQGCVRERADGASSRHAYESAARAAPLQNAIRRGHSLCVSGLDNLRTVDAARDKAHGFIERVYALGGVAGRPVVTSIIAVVIYIVGNGITTVHRRGVSRKPTRRDRTCPGRPPRSVVAGQLLLSNLFLN